MVPIEVPPVRGARRGNIEPCPILASAANNCQAISNAYCQITISAFLAQEAVCDLPRMTVMSIITAYYALAGDYAKNALDDYYAIDYLY